MKVWESTVCCNRNAFYTVGVAFQTTYQVWQTITQLEQTRNFYNV